MMSGSSQHRLTVNISLIIKFYASLYASLLISNITIKLHQIQAPSVGAITFYVITARLGCFILRYYLKKSCPHFSPQSSILKSRNKGNSV